MECTAASLLAAVDLPSSRVGGQAGEGAVGEVDVLCSQVWDGRLHPHLRAAGVGLSAGAEGHRALLEAEVEPRQLEAVAKHKQMQYLLRLSERRSRMLRC